MSKGVFKRKEVVHQEQIKSFSYHYERPLESPVSADMWAQAANSISKSDKQQMPTDLNKLPFVLPKNVDGHEKINNILKYSLHQQKVEEISDNAAIVTLVVSRCLAAADINHKVVYGYRKVHHDSNSSDNPLPFAVAPHVWMVIKDYIIDNAYIKKMPERTCNYLHDHMPGCYEESNNEFNELLALQSEIPDACRPRGMMKKRITFSMRHPDMALALGHNNEHFYNYFFSMIRHMYEEHKVTVKGIDPTIRLICWGCESYPQNGIHLYSDTLALRISGCQGDEVKLCLSPSSNTWRFQQCSRCMIANYCSKECQKRDWLDNHETTCLSRGSVSLPPISKMPFGGHWC